MAQQHEILRTVIKSRGGGVMSLILENEPTHRIDLYMTPHPDRVHSSCCLNGQFLALFDLTIDLRIVLADGVRYRMLKDRGGPIETLWGNQGLAHGNHRISEIGIWIRAAGGFVRVDIDGAEVRTNSVDVELTRFLRSYEAGFSPR